MKPYTLCNALREGPNVSHRHAIKPMIWGAIFAAAVFCAVWAWKVQP